MFERFKRIIPICFNALFRGLELMIPGLGQLISGHTIKGSLLVIFIAIPLGAWIYMFYTNCMLPVFPAFGTIEEHLAHHRSIIFRYLLLLIPFAAGWIYNIVDILSGGGQEEAAMAGRVRTERSLNITG